MMIINLLPTVCSSRTKLPLQCGSQSQFGLRNPRIWQLSDVTNCSSFGCFRVHIPSWCLCLLGRELVIHHGTTGSYRLSEHCLCPAPEQIPFLRDGVYQASGIRCNCSALASKCSNWNWAEHIIFQCGWSDLIEKFSTQAMESLISPCVQLRPTLTFHLSLLESECTSVGVAIGLL